MASDKTSTNSVNNHSNTNTPTINNVLNSLNNMNLKEKNNESSQDNRLTDRLDKEKLMQHHLIQQQQQQQAIVRPKPKELDGYVGFANLPNQVYRKAVKKGIGLCI